MSRVTAVGISESNLAELIFTHINDLVVWCRMIRVSKKFNQVGTELSKVVKRKDTFSLKLQNGYEFIRWYHADKCFWTKKNLLNGKEHGVCNVWWYSGQLVSEVYKLHGRMNGLRKEWYESGQLQCIQNLRNDKFHGLSAYWSEDGHLLSVKYYCNGKLSGFKLESLVRRSL